MKANGATSDVIYSFFVYRFLLLALMSAFITSLAIFLYSNVVNLFFVNTLSIISVLAFLFTVYYSSYSVTSSLIQLKNPFAYFMRIYESFSESVSSLARKLSWKSRYALLILKRSGKISKLLGIAILVNFFLLAFLTAGYFTFSDTTAHYIKRSIGSNVVAIGPPDMIFFYKSFNSFQESVIPVNLSDELIPDVVFNNLQKLSFISKIERRLIIEANVKVILQTRESSSSFGHVKIISEPTYAVGIEFSNLTSNWLLYGDFPNSSSQVLVGDSLDTLLLTQGTYDALYLFNQKFYVSGVCLTTENKGNVVYVSLRMLNKISNVKGFNLILVQLSELTPDILSKLSASVHAIGYEFLILDDIAKENISTIQSLWSYISIVIASIVISTISAIGTFVFVQLSLNSRELLSMYLLGASRKDYTEIAFAMGFISIIQVALPGYILGSLLGYLILFKTAFLSSSSILYILLLIIAMLFFMITVFRSISIQLYTHHKERDFL